MKAFLLDVEKNEAGIVDIDDSKPRREQYAKYLNCEKVGIVYRMVGRKKYFDIIIDDEGIFKDGSKISALTSDELPALRGNLLFCNHDENIDDLSPTDDKEIDNETSVTEDDVKLLLSHLAVARYKGIDEDFNVMADVDIN